MRSDKDLHRAHLSGGSGREGDGIIIIIIIVFSGVDVTVVDSNNKTVLDLLASHPSAKTREIKDLIYGEFYLLVNSLYFN